MSDHLSKMLKRPLLVWGSVEESDIVPERDVNTKSDVGE